MPGALAFGTCGAVNFTSHAPRLLTCAFVALALLVLDAPAAEFAKGKLIPEVRLRNGTVLHDVTVVAVGNTSVVAKWNGGRGSIPYSQLPSAMAADLAPPPPPAAPTPAPAAAVPVDPNAATADLPTEIKLTNGFVMHRSTVKRWEANAVLVSYQGGIVSVRFANMTPEHRAIFEAHKDEALARQARDDANATVSDQSAGQAAEAQRAKEARDQEAADAKAEEIRNGISFHYLVKGMTKAEVKQAYGRPVDDHGDVFVYILRGHDKYGNSADRSLMFQEGKLIGWKDQREGDPDGAVEH